MIQARPDAAQSREDLRRMLRDYYGRQLKQTADLSSKACCTEDTNQRYAQILSLLPEEVTSKHYGCGCPLPVDKLEGLTVLDLGSGAGVDAFIALHRVGPNGQVYGVDMTPEQLDVSRRNTPVVLERYGYDSTNIAFLEGYIETAEDIAPASIDLVISDCVINLSPAKQEVFKTIWRVLKPGGEVYVSDIATDRRVPEKVRNDPLMIAECLGGALYEHDWMDIMKDAGFADPRVQSRRVVQTEAMDEPITFFSLNVRAFKLARMDRRCEDYGQAAIYDGGIEGSEARYVFDDHHVFEAGRPTPVCRNTARMLSETRLAPYFEVSSPVRHFGLFACGSAETTPSIGNPCC